MKTESIAAVEKVQRSPGSILRKIKKQRSLLFALTPALLFVLVFQYFPIYGIIAAFQNFDIIDGYRGSEFVGLRHFRTLFFNTLNVRPGFWEVFFRTLNITAIRLFVETISAIAFALMLNELRVKRFKKIVQSVSYLPHFLSWAIIAGLVYRFLDFEGPLNKLLAAAFHMEPVQFMARPEYFIPIFIITSIWKEIGFSSIIYLAALSAIDPQLYEAGTIDGAGRWKLTWNITLPGIVPTIVTLFILRIGSLVNVGFDSVWSLQNDLIRSETHVLDTYIYNIGLQQANYSFGIATGLFQGLLAMVLVFGTNYISQKVSEIGIYKA